MKTALINARVITMNEQQPGAEAVLVEGEKIAGVGFAREIALLADETVDLNGRTVLPGFVDAHVHVVWTGMALKGIDLIGARSIQEIVDRVSQAARDVPRGEWLFGNGHDESIIEEHRPPTRFDLDRASDFHPILIRGRGGHCCVVNTRALSTIKPRAGAADGVLRGEANRHALAVTGQWLDDEARLDAVRRCAELALSRGVTTMHAMQRVVGENDEFVLRLCDAEFPARIVVYPTTTDIDWAVRHGFSRIGGCLLIDGGVESHTAAVFGGYSDRPETNGRLYFSDEDLYQFFRKANAAGLQMAVHAIGERGIAHALDAHEKIFRDSPREDHRHRMEHFLVPRREDVKRAADLGVAVCAQPAFERFWGGRDGWFARFLGSERMMRSTPLRSMLDENLLVGGGSDSYVTPIDPLLGAQAAVLHPNEKERISVRDALRMFTINGALLGFMEEEIGSIAVGKRADFVVLSEDPTRCDPSRLTEIAVEQTWVGGKCAWRKNS